MNYAGMYASAGLPGVINGFSEKACACFCELPHTGTSLIDVLAAEWIHFTLLGIILPTIRLKVYTFGAYELSN